MVHLGHMITIHPNVLECNGKRAFVALPHEEFVMIEGELQEYEDLKELRVARTAEAGELSVSLRDACRSPRSA